MKIFWSWQSDHDTETGHYFVRDALKQAAKQLGQELELSEAERLEVDHDTKGVPGTPPILQTIFDKIEAATAFVADVTPVGSTPAGKPLPNPNVMIELGYARRSRGYQRLILVANGHHLAKPEDLPFDLRGDRGPTTYSLSESADGPTRKAQQALLVAALKRNLAEIVAFEQKERAVSSLSTTAIETDVRTLWFADDEPLTHVDRFARDAKRVVHFRAGPHSFMRIRPAYWPQDIRTAALSPDGRRQMLAIGHGRNGDWGQNAQGVLSYWFADTPEDAPRQATVLAQWFAESGVAWSVWDRILSEDSPPWFYWKDVMRLWGEFLQLGIGELTAVGARGPFRVDAGVTGIMGSRWGGSNTIGSMFAAKDEVRRSTIDVTTAILTQHQFLASLFNRLSDAFGASSDITVEQVQSILDQ